MGKKVLLVDDDEKLQKLVKEYLEDYGFRVLTVSDGSLALNAVASESPDLVVLDIMLPGKDGLEILKEIRSKYTVPVIMLTAKGEDADRIVGLELGADDYVPKPFNPRELLARARAVLRRPPHLKGTETEQDKLIRVGGVTLNKARQTLLVEDTELDLSSTEYKILEVLMKRPNVVLTRDQLMTLSRGRDFMAFDRSIDVHISKLRTKLKPFSKYRECIKTVWGTGYMFVEIP
ncbi:MAG: response regulator transcription factor [Deltaproteobacteria bacterium]|nr:response regulator transcription factor [Deltaproteobacteria bacterium]